MNEHSDLKENEYSIQEKLIGIGEHSFRKTYYPQLHEQLEYLEEKSAALLNMLEDLEEARRKLEESEGKFRAVFEHTFQLMGLMTPDGKLLKANKIALEVIGCEEDDVLGKYLWDTPWWNHSTELQETLRVSIQKAANGEFIRFEAYHIGIDGKMYYVDFSIKPVMDENGIVVLLIPEGRDISERKQVEETLRASEEKYRTLIQKIQVAVIVHGTDTGILTCNSKAQELLGLTEDQLLGKTAIDPDWHFFREDSSVMPVDEHPVNQVFAAHQSLRNLIAGVHRPNLNDNIWVLVNADPVFSKENEILQVIVTFTDITERKQAEKELKDQMDEINRFNKLMVGREEKMIELKKEINMLLEKEGKPKKYDVLM